MKPSDVKDLFPAMGLGDAYKELAALWTARALAETGDTWRVITWEEIEPLLAPGFNESLILSFKKYLPNLDSEEKAKKIWAFALRHQEKGGDV